MKKTKNKTKVKIIWEVVVLAMLFVLAITLLAFLLRWSGNSGESIENAIETIDVAIDNIYF